MGDVIAASGFRGVSRKLGIQVDYRMSLKSSLVDLGDFACFPDYSVPLRVLRQHMLRSTSHNPPHQYHIYLGEKRKSNGER